MSKKSPTDFLKTVLGRPIIVKLNTGVEYRGTSGCELWCIIAAYCGNLAARICCGVWKAFWRVLTAT